MRGNQLYLIIGFIAFGVFGNVEFLVDFMEWNVKG